MHTCEKTEMFLGGEPDKPQATNMRCLQIVSDGCVLLLVLAVYALLNLYMSPTQAYLTCGEIDQIYPFKSNTVSTPVLFIYGFFGPLFFILVVELLNSKLDMRKLKVCVYEAVSMFVLGLAITMFLTELAKRMVGRLRPHFLDVCRPEQSRLTCGNSSLLPIFTGDDFCTGNADLIDEARLSFPSGHASFSMYSMVYLIVFLHVRLVVVRLRFVKIALQLAAVTAVVVTSLSRVVDYHHWATDVLGGVVLGLSVALAIIRCSQLHRFFKQSYSPAVRLEARL